jgi:DivIVA domain-containing protein
MSKSRPAWQRWLAESPNGADGRGRRITPETVRNKKFATTRLTQGYAVEEVDAFLDEVTQEIALLIRERDEARAAASHPPREDQYP